MLASEIYEIVLWFSDEDNKNLVKILILILEQENNKLVNHKKKNMITSITKIDAEIRVYITPRIQSGNLISSDNIQEDSFLTIWRVLLCRFLYILLNITTIGNKLLLQVVIY